MSGEEIDEKSVGNSAVYLLVDFEKTLYYETSVERDKALYYKTSVERDKAQPDFVAASLSPPYIQEDLR